MKIGAIAATAGIFLALGLGTAGVVIEHGQADQLGQARDQVTMLQKQLRDNNAKLARQVGLVQTQMAGLSQPTDPLSAYNQICNQQFTNDATGITQTYYLPCTNQATTIPQPGG